jgi:hypothetical protein
MLWARAKTIILGYLLLVNLILGMILVYRAWEDRREAAAINPSLVRVLEGFGVSVAENALPPGNQRLPAYEIRFEDGEAPRFAEGSFGTLEDLLAILASPGELIALPGSESGLNAATALVRHVTAKYGSAAPIGSITAVEPGYIAVAVAHGVLRLTPVWRIIADETPVLLNAVTSQIEAVPQG